MTEQLQTQLIEIALESATKLFGEVIAYNGESIVFENKKTGEKKRMTYTQMHKTLNEVISEVRK